MQRLPLLAGVSEMALRAIERRVSAVRAPHDVGDAAGAGIDVVVRDGAGVERKAERLAQRKGLRLPARPGLSAVRKWRTSQDMVAFASDRATVSSRASGGRRSGLRPCRAWRCVMPHRFFTVLVAVVVVLLSARAAHAVS